MFVTFFYGVVEVASRRLNYSLAGRDYPMLIRNGKVRMLSWEGALLGYLGSKQLCLSEESFELKSGDRLVLYIDGLMDVTSLDRRRFELEGLVELLENFPDLSVEVLGHEIFNTLAECRGMNEQYDDMPLLIAEVLTPHHTNL